MFSVGDKVRIKSPESEYDGSTGEIVSINDHRGRAPRTVNVRIDGWTGPGFPFADAELIGPELSRSARLSERIRDALVRYYGRRDD